MSMSLLPEERIHDILSHLLHIPYRMFNRRGRWRTERTHQALQVCRLWLRIGTPLLYECLVLSTRAHATSVARLFRAHPHIAAAVRCLKLQGGGFGAELRGVVQFLPQRLATLYVCMSFDAAAHTDGLAIALPALRPAALYLEGRLGQACSDAVQRVDGVLARAIRSGTWALDTFVVAQDDGYYFSDTLAAALAESPTLRRLVLDPYYLLVRAFFARVAVIAMNPNLQEIACVPGRGPFGSSLINVKEVLPRERNPVVRARMQRLFTFPKDSDF